MTKKSVVRLAKDEPEGLQRLASVGKGSARRRTHARAWLQADESKEGPGWTDTRMAEVLGASVRTIETIRRRFVEAGRAPALERKKRLPPPVEARLDGEKEARLIAACRSPAPKGRERGTPRWPADRLVEGGASISQETARRVLKKTS